MDPWLDEFRKKSSQKRLRTSPANLHGEMILGLMITKGNK
jgi:hypothetical protein